MLLSEDLKALGRSSDKHVAAGPPLNFQLPQYFLSGGFLDKSLTFFVKAEFCVKCWEVKGGREGRLLILSSLDP